MRLLLMFDMPTESLDEKRAYRKFRKFLVSEGFIMHQYSIYTKILLNGTAKNLLVKRIYNNNPKKGLITLLTITEKQFAKMIYISGKRDDSIANTDSRIVFFGDDYSDEV